MTLNTLPAEIPVHGCGKGESQVAERKRKTKDFLYLRYRKEKL
jgi:hypothetical protein